MKNFKLISSIIFCMFSTKAKAQLLTWNKTVDSTKNEAGYLSYIYSIVKKTNSNHIVYLQSTQPTSDTLGNSYNSLYISKQTVDGNTVWKKTHILDAVVTINDFVETTDKGFLLIGEMIENNIITKLDSNGNIVFTINYPNPDNLMKFDKIVAANDGNYILTSYQQNHESSCIYLPVDYSKVQTYISKINPAGNMIWQQLLSENSVRKLDYNLYNYQLTDNISAIDFDFYDNTNQTFNALYYSKEYFDDGELKLMLMHFDNNGNKLDSAVLNTQNVISNNGSWFCSYDRTDLRVKKTQNGYTLYKLPDDSDSFTGIKKIFFNKQGQSLDTTIREITDINLLGIYQYAVYNYINVELMNDIHYTSVRPLSIDFISNSYDYFRTDTDFVLYGYENSTLTDSSIFTGSSKFITALNDTTLLLVAETNKYSAYDTVMYLKFYRISLNSNKIYYSIYIDRNNNSYKDNSDTTFYDCLIEFNHENTITDLQPNPFGTYTKYLLNGNYISKLISYNQTLKYYDVDPISKTTIFPTDTRGIDSVFFRLTPKPNIQDLQVSIVPTIAARPGFSSSYKIIAKNVGTKIMYSPTVKFMKDSLQTFMDSATYVLDADTLFWQIDSLGLLEQQEVTISLLNATPPTLNSNDTLHLYAQILPLENDSFVQDNYGSLHQVVRNSVDPNDKIETHGGNIPYTAIQNRDYLYYTIRFQNTGNSYASRIVITDTLTDNVDPATLEFLASSVPFIMNVVDRKYITWTAASTFLPDSTSDEINSHGYISFRIKPKAGLSPSDEITNRASIIFDYNEAISTNTCTTKIIEQRILSVKNNTIKSIQLFPNPTNGNVQLNMDLLQNKNYALRISDINGNVLSNENIKGNSGENLLELNLSNYANGLYFIQLSDETGNLFYGKIVKQ